jgi:NADPH:quinone reductase-like Zn-dependent oxidoreductase
MKAACNYEYGDPSVLIFQDIPKPVPRDDEILVKVHYSGVNRTDDGFLRAKPFVTRFFSGLVRPRNIVLGCEFAGEVVQVGSDVGEFTIGDNVFGFDDVKWGGHAQFKVMNADKMVTRVPKNITLQQAGVSTEGAHYALSYVEKIKKLNARKVLVHGATGSIGSAAVQLLKYEGIEVIATSTTKSMKMVKSLGADKVIDWQKEDFTKLDIKVDVVFDSVGKSSFNSCKNILNENGVYIATELGTYGQNPLLGIVSPAFKMLGQKRVLFPLPLAKKEIIVKLAKIIEEGKFKPVIDKTYKLEDVAKAYQYVNSGQKTGNVSVEIINK